ncbi:MAG: ATP-binding protein [Anaerolineae bacterium]
MFKNLQIGTRLTLIVSVTFFIVLIIITFIEISSSENALRTQTIARFTDKSTRVVAQINQEFLRLNGTIRALATAVGNMGNPNAANELRQVVANFVASDGDVLATRFNVLRPDGSIGALTMNNPLVPSQYQWRIWASASEIPNRNDPIEGRFYEPLRTGEVAWFIQDRTFFDPERQSSITLAAPYSINNRIAGVVWMDIPRASFQRLLTQFMNNEGLLADTRSGYVLLVDQTGQLVTVHNLQLRNQALTSDQSSLVMQERDTGVAQVAQRLDPIRQEPSYVNVRQFAVNNWRYIATYPESEIPTLPSAVLGPILIVSLFGVVTLTIVINQFIGRSVALPLRNLGRSAQEIGAGDFRYFIPHRDRRDEIGKLAEELENMRVGLERSYDELSRWSRTLERRVIERTKELDIARQEAESAANELTAVYNESLLVVSESQLKPILDALAARLPSLLAASYAAVWLLNDERDRMQLVATSDSKQREGWIIRVGEGIAGQSVLKGEPQIVDDYAHYEHNLLAHTERTSTEFNKAMAVPLVYLGKPIGALVVGRGHSQPTFNEADLRLLSLFANLVTPSVRNAQLFVRLNNAVEATERANQVKTRFLASVTHELRTPLNLVINNMDFMRIGAFGPVTPEQAERLGQTIRSAEHLLYLINDLLDVSKIEAGEMQLFIQEADVYTMLDDCIDNTVAFIEKIDGKADAVEFVADIDDELPRLPMDVRRIRQVLTNLLTNAVKFTERGTVTLRVEKVKDGVRFSVTDTGMGIAPEEADKLFAAFERTESAKANMIEGTGLGLPISKYLVEQHGGELTFTSEVGVGTTFTFTLPTQLTPEDSQTMRRPDPSIAAMLSSKTQ